MGNVVLSLTYCIVYCDVSNTPKAVTLKLTIEKCIQETKNILMVSVLQLGTTVTMFQATVENLQGLHVDNEGDVLRYLQMTLHTCFTDVDVDFDWP